MGVKMLLVLAHDLNLILWDVVQNSKQQALCGCKLTVSWILHGALAGPIPMRELGNVS
jgi:hypothetical protein